MRRTKIIFNQDALIVMEKSNSRIFLYADIVGIFCERPYLKIETICKSKKLIFHSLTEMEQLLPDSFTICNRSTIVNLEHIIQHKTEKFADFIHLICGRKILVSRRRKNDVISKIKSLLTA